MMEHFFWLARRYAKAWRRTVAMVAISAACAGLAQVWFGASPRAQGHSWAVKECFSSSDVTIFLNTLDASSAIEAKIVTARGTAAVYYVWYRK